ncbi:Low-density lipoprotein receptor-related protein 6 [Operophtera brumata]|uniref:Low-density lipoprotein receptor-related protein 6 n=1 Tax=Operophtera brumata TaxID=104452 RepID=A0A0L7LI23_OPEBR|nr:Low-density lipoprotein receptor-related protein 6 [Operophtera brumata]
MMGVKAFRIGEPLGSNRCADTNGGCSHLCFNRPEDYTCGCPLEAYLLYSRKNIIGRISIENEKNDAILPIKDLKEVSALAVHTPGSKLYWSDSKTKTINRCSINGINTEKILEWMGLVEGLAIDWSGQNIYWTDSATQRIEVARLDGSSRRALIWQGLKKPKSIVLDYKKGKGGGRGLAIDWSGQNIYWTDSATQRIEVARLDGSSRRALIWQGLKKPKSIVLDYKKGRAACTPWLSSTRRARCTGRRWTRPRSSAPSSTGRAAGCSSTTFRCQPEDFLLFAQKNAIGRISVTSGESNDAYIPLTGLKNVKAIEQLYWMDDESHNIKRVPLSYSTTSAVTDSSVVVSNLLKPFHMVFDVLGRTLYWTCADTDSINATSALNASSTGVVLRGDNMMPRHLAFHQTKSNVDGTERVELARAANASALTVDQASGTLYYALTRQIHAVEIDGTNRYEL